VQTALRALSSIGSAGVTTGGGPSLALRSPSRSRSPRGPERAAHVGNATGLTGGTTPAVAVVETTAGFGQYDAQTGWQDLGATKGGITIARNNAEETFDVDQIQADIMSLPTAWEMNGRGSIAQADIDTIQYLWEGGTITVDGTTGERTLPAGHADGLPPEAPGVLFQRQSSTTAASPPADPRVLLPHHAALAAGVVDRPQQDGRSGQHPVHVVPRGTSIVASAPTRLTGRFSWTLVQASTAHTGARSGRSLATSWSSRRMASASSRGRSRGSPPSTIRIEHSRTP
jgi:hypothetical protein